jgi:hypothetical protein
VQKKQEKAGTTAIRKIIETTMAARLKQRRPMVNAY